MRVIKHTSAKILKQSTKAPKSSSTLDLIKRMTVSKNNDKLLRLYILLVMSKLEYFIQVWNTFLKLKPVDNANRCYDLGLEGPELWRKAVKKWAKSIEEEEEEQRRGGTEETHWKVGNAAVTHTIHTWCIRFVCTSCENFIFFGMWNS